MIVKVCGMRLSANIRQVDRLAIDWMGFIFYPPSPRCLKRIPRYLPEQAKRVGVFVDADSRYIQSRAKQYGLLLLQLHGRETPDECRHLRETTGCPIIKAISISETTDFDLLCRYEGAADYFLFDTATAARGGSGRQFDHRLLCRYKGRIPFLLSGGLGPDDVTTVLECQSHPQFAGIDLNSRFELRPGVKNAGLLQHFLNTLRKQTSKK